MIQNSKVTGRVLESTEFPSPRKKKLPLTAFDVEGPRLFPPTRILWGLWGQDGRPGVNLLVFYSKFPFGKMNIGEQLLGFSEI